MRKIATLIVASLLVSSCSDKGTESDPDTQSPFIAWVSPRVVPDSLGDFTHTTDTVTIEFNVGDNQATDIDVDIYLADSLVRSLSAPPYRVILDLTPITNNRSAQIYATATDPSGNVGRTAYTLTFNLVLPADTATWTPLSVGTSPAPRVNHSFSLDISNRRALLFGGYLLFAAADSDELWAFNFDSDTWDSLSPSGTLPSPRSRHGAEVVGNTLVMRGGLASGISDTVLEDHALLNISTLTWNSNLYYLGSRKIMSMGTASSSSTAFFYSGARANGGAANDSLWSYTEAGGWVLLDHTAEKSPDRVYAATAFNLESDVFILVGGSGTEGALPSNGSIYLFDVGQATWQANPPPDSAPPPTQKAEMVYDSLNHRMLMWGGSDDAGTLSTDLWQFSLGAEIWQRVPTKGVLPGGRIGHRMVIDADNSRFIMFGGGAFSETWELRWP